MQKTIAYLFYLLIILLPLNFRHIFNFEQIRHIEGFREHISWSLYAFDIVFAVLLGVFIIKHYKLIRFRKVALSFLAVETVLMISATKAFDITSAAYQTTRIIEVLLFFLVAKELLKDQTVFNRTTGILFFSGILQSLIAALQFFFQRSLGLRYLGESVLSPSMLGVAKIEVADNQFIRAYGTFPHPNILGAFLLMSAVCGVYLYQRKKISGGQQGMDEKALACHDGILKLGMIIIIVGIFLSFSRSAWLVTGMGFLILVGYFSLIRLQKARTPILHQVSFSRPFTNYNIPLTVAVFSIILLFLIPFTRARLCLTDCANDFSYSLRKTYNSIAVRLIQSHPLWGVGPGNFIPSFSRFPAYKIQEKFTFASIQLQPWDWQPAHNLYLLVASEIGLPGLVVFLVFAALQWRPGNRLFAYAFIAYLALGLFDHYFWTLPQGQFLLWLSLALQHKS